MKITYFGTTVLLFDDGENQILFDCHFTRPTIGNLLLRKIRTNKRVCNTILLNFKFDRLKAIFISHTHYDHVMDAPYITNKTGADIYGSPSTKYIVEGGDVNMDKYHSYEDCMDYEIGEFKIKIIKSIHSIPRVYNDDIGEVITKPVIQPCFKSEYKEGGSYDFIIYHKDKVYIIRPSYNFIEHQLDEYHADVMFLGCAGLERDTKERVNQFFKETIDKVNPSIVIPIHWDRLYEPLREDVKPISGLFDDGEASLKAIENYCKKHKIAYIQQKPLTTLDL